MLDNIQRIANELQVRETKVFVLEISILTCLGAMKYVTQTHAKYGTL